MAVGGGQGTRAPSTKADASWWLPQEHHWDENSMGGAVQHRKATMLIGMTHPALFRAFGAA